MILAVVGIREAELDLCGTGGDFYFGNVRFTCVSLTVRSLFCTMNETEEEQENQGEEDEEGEEGGAESFFPHLG